MAIGRKVPDLRAVEGYMRALGRFAEKACAQDRLKDLGKKSEIVK
jgi:hypothetical protein